MPGSTKWHRVFPESTDRGMIISQDPIKSRRSTSVPDHLCQSCQALELGSAYAENQVATGSIYDVEDPDHPGFRSLWDLKESADYCDCCRFLLGCLKRIILVTHPDTNGGSMLDEGLRQCRLLGLWVRVATASFASPAMQQTSVLTVSFEDTYSGKALEAATDFVLARQKPNGVAHLDGYVRWIPRDLIALEAAEVIQAWYEDCTRCHTTCNTLPEMRTFTPDRLVYVGSLREPALYLSCYPPALEPYIALSYCWGPNHEHKTTQANLALHQMAIGEGSLPKTYQDVISIARALKIRWLWIDAFCIIQGNIDDWNQQSYSMDVIYRNAHLTICASNAKSVQEGFLGIREPAMVPCGSTVINDSEEILYLTEGVDADAGGASLGSEPLTHRGWTVQERVLSRRSVYFTAQQMLWQCSSACHGEIGISDYGVQDWQKSMLRAGRMSTDTSADAINWRRSVTIFSRCQLTNQSDRLPAISGLAKQYSMILKDRYVAGHWLSTLLEDLVWYRVAAHAKAELRQRLVYRAPSWSWAAVDGPIKFSGSHHASSAVARVSSVEVVPKGTNVFGEVSSGYIDIHTRCCRATLSSQHPSNNLTITYEHGGESHTFVQRGNQTIPQVFLDHSLDTLSVVAAIISVRLFRYPGNEPTQQAWSGLLLLPMDPDRSQYTRVGGFIDQRLSTPIDLEDLEELVLQIV